MTVAPARGARAALPLCCLGTATARGDVGDPQVRTDHPWRPGELACSTFDRLAAAQAAVFARHRQGAGHRRAEGAGRPVRVRFRNDDGKSYARAEAHLVYRVRGADPTKVTFAWADDGGEHRADHTFAAEGGDWHLPAGRGAPATATVGEGG